MKEKKKSFLKRIGSGKTAIALSWIARLIAGATFVYSGFVKSIDPWGTLYKMQDYTAAMGIDVWPNLLLTGVFILCGMEFLMGVFLLLGCFRRSTPIIMALFMAVMLPLTLWIAVADPVADCGCFGDALIISNWATFWKNVVLTLLVVWLIKYNRRCRCLIEPFAQWLVFSATALYTVAIAMIGYIYQPLIDFRPYPVGTVLIDPDSASDEDAPSGDENLVFVYERNGVKKEFSADDELPDEADGWQFVERKEVAPAPMASDSTAKTKPAEESHRNFRIWSEDGQEDVTEMAAPAEGRRLVLMMPELSKVSIAKSWAINSLYTWAGQNNVDMIAVVNGSSEEIARWKDLSLASYPIYTSDDTQIEEVVRGNPAVVYTENGVIVWKSTFRALMTDDFLSPETSKDPKTFSRDDRRMLVNLTLIYVAVLAFLILISYSPAMSRLFFRRRPKAEKKTKEKKTKKGNKD